MNRTQIFVATAAASLALAGCASLPPALTGSYESSAHVYTPDQAQQVQRVQIGTVIDVQNVLIAAGATETTTGSAVGAALGALTGGLGGQGNGKTALRVVGALVGGVAGNKAAGAAYKQPGLQIAVRLDGGDVVSVTQAADVQIGVGQRVQLIGADGWSGQPARVVQLAAGASR